jgi:alanine racemase
MVKELRAGETAGYGRDFVASETTNIALLPVGYSHGYPFALSGKARVLIGGRSYPLAGRVSMDYVAVDLGKAKVAAAEVATLIGRDGSEEINVRQLAEWAGTIPYEIVTGLHPEVPRIVISEPISEGAEELKT